MSIATIGTPAHVAGNVNSTAPPHFRSAVSDAADGIGSCPQIYPVKLARQHGIALAFDNVSP